MTHNETLVIPYKYDYKESTKSFYKLSDALKWRSSCSNKNLGVFAYETGRQGRRKFLVSSIEEFYTIYERFETKNCYEVITCGPRKMYFDIEYKKDINVRKDGISMTKEFINIVNRNLLNLYQIENNIEEILILDSCSENKFSLHLVFLKIVWKTNGDLKNFVRYTIRNLSVSERKMFLINTKTENEQGLFIDQSVYRLSKKCILIDQNNKLIH